MKIIHLADVHLGATNRKLNSSLQKSLKLENGNRLKYVFEYAKKIDAEAIIISGDLFHSKNPTLQLVKFFVEALKSIDIPVFYVKGNHDEDFAFSNQTLPNNFIVFGGEFSSISLKDNVVVSGQSGNNIEVKALNSDKFNIVVLHGDIHSKGNDYIDLGLCKNKNINYLALGHLHTFEEGKLDSRGQYVYPGCLTGNGFDECGGKGFVVLDTETGASRFVELEGKQFAIASVDITGFKNFDELCEKIDSALKKYSKDDFVRLEFLGEYEEDEDKFLGLLLNKYNKLYNYFEIVDKSKLKIDKEKLKQEVLSFKAEFLKLVSEDDKLSDEDKNEIFKLGISALRGDDL